MHRQTVTRRTFHAHTGFGFSLGAGVVVLVLVLAVSLAAPAEAAKSGNRPLGVTGSVAALSGSSMEVQNPSSGQTTVSWTGSTQFTKTVSESVASVAVGDCVTATGTASKKSKTKVVAHLINVHSAPASGSCTAAGPTRGGPGPAPGTGVFHARSSGGDNAGHLPGPKSGFKFSRHGAGSRKASASLSIASGKVISVDGSALDVSGILVNPRDFPRTKDARSKKHPARQKTEKLTITTSSSTSVSATQSAAATDLAVGDCVSAFGPAASNGAVTANSVRITPTGGGSCTGVGPQVGGGPTFIGGPGAKRV